MRSHPRRRLRRTRLALTLARVRRSTLFSLVAALSAAGLAGATTAQTVSSAADARARWGDLVEVAVVRDAVAAGERIPRGAVERVMRPERLLPPGATASAAGRVTLAALVPGDVVVEARLADRLMPHGWRAVGVAPPMSGAHPDVSVGDRVEILDVGGAEPTAVAQGTVAAVRASDGMVTVVVPGDRAGAVAYAAVSGSAVITLTALPPRR